MVNTPKFYPSQLQPLSVRIIQSLSYIASNLAYKIDLKIDQESIDRFKKIEESRIVLLANHPTFDDGIVMFLLSTRLGELFNYLVAYESFKGLLGKFLQTIGAYSVNRGLGDRKSVEYTLNLLKQPNCRLVVFPEGGCSFQNDTVMPFRSGATQLAFKAFSQLVKAEGKTSDFYFLPVSIKYIYQKPINHIIVDTLKRLEQYYQIQTPTQDFYPRLRQVSEAVLQDIEKQYDLDISKTSQQDWNQRISHLRIHLLNICADKLDLKFSPNTPPRERVYKMQSLLESLENDPSAYEFIYRATLRLLNFDAIYDGYVAEYPTPERFMDTLTRLEREAFKIDRPVAKAKRQARVYIGEPINLKDYLDKYEENRTATVEDITTSIQETVQSNIGLLNEECTNLE